MSSTATQRLRVVYITGTGRSGSTLLDRLIGNLPGAFSGGELLRLWSDGLVLRRLCSCERPLPECPVWTDILARLEHLLGEAPPAQAFAERQADVLALRHLHRLIPADAPRRRPDVAEHVRVYGALFEAIAETTGAAVIVDSSKRPQQAAALRHVGSIDLYLIHLVRDPRGVARSMQKQVLMQPQRATDPMQMARARPAKSARLWMKWNLTAEAVKRLLPTGRSRLVRYEDLVRRPQEVLGGIAAWLGLDDGDLRFQQHNVVDLQVAHGAWGNPMRFRTGPTPIAPDDGWQEALPATDRNVVTVATAPLLVRYRYPKAGPVR